MKCAIVPGVERVAFVETHRAVKQIVVEFVLLLSRLILFVLVGFARGTSALDVTAGERADGRRWLLGTAAGACDECGHAVSFLFVTIVRLTDRQTVLHRAAVAALLDHVC